MRARILEAAVRVLQDDGALDFTTTRVADEAGISVGSLYQYFPNKHALVLAIHQEAVQRGWEHVQSILDDLRQSPRQKVVAIASWFFAIESSEAANLGAVFDDIEVFLRDSHEDATLDHEVKSRFLLFLTDTYRDPQAKDAEFDAQLLITTLEAIGKTIAARQPNQAERERWAVATATMLCDHLGIEDP